MREYWAKPPTPEYDLDSGQGGASGNPLHLEKGMNK
jgi:hypothetical protein